MFKTLFAVSVLTLMAGQAAAICPLAPNGPSLPAITNLEIIDPNVPNKPYAAAPGMNSRDVATFTGGALGKATMILQVTLDRAVEANCPLSFDIIMPYEDFFNQNPQAATDVGKVFPIENATRSRSYLIGQTTGGNVLRLTVPLLPNLGSERTYAFRLYLGTIMAGQPAPTFREFQIRNRGLRLAQLKRVDNGTGPIAYGSQIEIVATLNERLDPALNSYMYRRSYGYDFPARLVLTYTLQGGGRLSGIEDPTINRSWFDEGFADGGDHIFYTAPAETVTPTKGKTTDATAARTLPGVRGLPLATKPSTPATPPVGATITVTLSNQMGDRGNSVALSLTVD